MQAWVMMKIEDASKSVAERAQYSNADKSLEDMDRLLQLFQKMKDMDDNNLRPSLEDPTLLTQKEVYLDDVNKVVYSEEVDVMFVTAKKVLSRFWRHIIPVDAETQTDFNLVQKL